MSDNSEEKTEDASKRKLKKQREQGSLPRTSDMASILNVIVAIIVLAATGSSILENYKILFESVIISIFQTDGSTSMPLGLKALVDGLIQMTFSIVLGTLAMLFVATTLYQGGLPFSMKPLVPDFNRLNPAQGFTRIFGRRSWIEAAFHLTRALVWLIVSAIIVWSIWNSIFRIDLCGPTCGLEVLWSLISRWVPVTLFVLISYLGFEMIVQKNLYLHEQKMSKSDVKRESKEQGGAPELRRERNRIRTQLTKEAENADKSLSNMCFYYADVTVGIRYNPVDTPMPRVTAKARGEDAVHLRRYIVEQGHPSMAHENLALKGYKISPGATINKDMFEELAMAMSKIYGKK